DHSVGKVPRRDRCRHADRFFQHHDTPVPRVGGNYVAINAAPFFSEPLDERGAVRDLAPRFGERLALFQRHDGGPVFWVFHAQLDPGAQDRRTWVGGQLPPAAEGLLGRRDRSAGFRRAERRHGAQLVAAGGIPDRLNRAVVSIDPITIEVALLTKQATIAHGHRLVLRIPQRARLIVAPW